MNLLLALVLAWCGATEFGLNSTARLVDEDGPAVQLRMFTRYMPVPDALASTRELDQSLTSRDTALICVRGKTLRPGYGVDLYVRRATEPDMRVPLDTHWSTHCRKVALTRHGSGVQVSAYGPSLNRVWVRNVQSRAG